MRKLSAAIAVSLLFVLPACKSDSTDHSAEAVKEIAQAEKDFESMAATKGIAEAFTFYADSSAVIRRHNDTLIHGRNGIRHFYSNDFFTTASVTWSPDFVSASPDGKMGYTFGKYRWQSRDSTGKVDESTGVFHTVWKKQPDGSWKYVWD